MMKHLRTLTVIFLFAPAFCLLGCASLFEKNNGDAHTLTVKGEPGRKEMIDYVSKSLEQQSAEGGVGKEQETTTRFTVESTVVKKDSDKVYFRIESIKHEGAFSLQDMGFPPLAEPMDLVLTAVEGKVLKAGDYPKDSTFYVPPVPLPKTPVQVGDTWNFQTSWVNMTTGAPFVLEMAVIFQKIETCGNQQCAKLEVSGDVVLNMGTQSSAMFKSELSGWINFGLTSGSLITSEIRSVDQVQSPEGLMNIYSCLGIAPHDPARKTPPDCKIPVR